MGDFASFQIANFEQILLQIDTFQTLLSSEFESLLWQNMILEKNEASNCIKLAFQKKSECGLKVLESELFSNSNRMLSLIENTNSSFYSLSQSDLLYLLKMDSLAINEEKLYNALKIWCTNNSESQSFEERMFPFLAHIRFPMMSFDFLLNNIMPIKDKLFANNDDFLFIIVYKLNLLFNTKSNDIKLCCSHVPRIYNEANKQSEMSMDARLIQLSAENKLLRSKLQKQQKKKRKSTKTESMENAIDSLSSSGRKRTRSVTNQFASFEHEVAVQNKRNSHKNKKAEDSIDLAQRQKHLKQVSESVIKTVQDLQMGNSSVNFIVKANEDNQANKDIFEQMRKKLTDRKEKVKTAHQRKLEKEKEERLQKERELKEMEETKKRIKEEAKKLKEQKKKRKKKMQKIVKKEDEQQNNEENEKEEVTEDKIIEQNDDDQIQNELNRLNEEMNHNQDENVANEQENESVVVAVENDYGYSTVHDAYKKYFGVHNAECTAAPKLLLFAKKNGISGVTFANANKYLKARKKDLNAVSLEDLANTKQPQIRNNNNADHEEEHDIISPKTDNENGADSDGSVHSGHSEHYQAETMSSDQTKADTPPITITQSMIDKHKTPTPEAPLQHETDDNKNNDNNDDDDVKQQQEVKKKSNLEVKPKKKKKKKTLFVAAEMLGKLKKATLYTRFELP